MGLGDAEEGAGGAFGAAMALLPVLEGAGTDGDEGGELVLAEAELLAHGLGIRRLQGGAVGGFRFSAKDGTALLEAGGELLEEFVFHGNSGRKNLRITGTVEGMEIAQIEGEESFRTGFAGSKEVKVIVDRATAHAAHFSFAEGRKEVVRVE